MRSINQADTTSSETTSRVHQEAGLYFNYYFFKTHSLRIFSFVWICLRLCRDLLVSLGAPSPPPPAIPLVGDRGRPTQDKQYSNRYKNGHSRQWVTSQKKHKLSPKSGGWGGLHIWMETILSLLKYDSWAQSRVSCEMSQRQSSTPLASGAPKHETCGTRRWKTLSTPSQKAFWQRTRVQANLSTCPFR